MGGGSVKSNPTKARKRVEASMESASAAPSLVRGKDGSAFTRCEECNKDVPVALISFHCCSLDAKIKMNLEAQVVEASTEMKKKPTEKKKSSSTEPKAKKAKVEKKAKKDNNPNKRKRPLTAFFLFLEEFRKEFKAANPDSKDVKAVTKDGGVKWRSMSDEEKKVYQDKAAELKAEYDKAVEADNAEDGEAEVKADDAEDGEEEAASEKEP
ncbi:High mobility group box domain containing protein [Parasponia andersonii]|uniref:High mobility group box domain containing protein n=1 Tax=Parasponia andersonii TaxID=3476 RepID=A0A2P5D4C6_PARAD|nr:High mobility group box domain containing protein [Parasponia andersonii]